MALLLILSFHAPDSLKYEIQEAVISAKNTNQLSTQPISSTTIRIKSLEIQRIESVKDFSAIVPNYYQPDYGSSMTSSIYVRGFGSRIDQPVVGLSIDEVPYLNKNSYDFDFFDIRKVEVLRGPQSTLYGRNTLGGLINIQTLSPLHYSGTRAYVGYGTGNTFDAKVSYYGKTDGGLGYSAGAFFSMTDGFFKNEYTGENCDSGLESSVRIKIEWENKGFSIRNSSSVGFVNQGGYAYRFYDSIRDSLYNVDYNDPGRYRRFTVNNGTVIKYNTGNLLFSSITGYQYLNDRMVIDNDFLPTPVFLLSQSQNEHTISQDIVVRSNDDSRMWQHVSGLFGFAKWLVMDAPLTMKREGIENLILKNANNGIHTVFPEADILIQDESFVIGSRFYIPTYGAALYHQSTFNMGKFHLTAGLRLDYENSTMDYDSCLSLSYRFNMTMDDYKKLSTRFFGSQNLSYLELLPKASLQYDLHIGNIYFSASKGYKAGGFNTQIFSDIMRNKMMSDMMSDLGVYFDDNASQTAYDDAAATTYLPEYTWNYELGGHLKWDNSLTLDFALFAIDCRNQQLTVFPKGKTMGRIMSNAGHSKSLGAEAAFFYKYRHFSISAQYGYADARFIDYSDGADDYSGNHIPYAPQNTVSVTLAYELTGNGNVFDSILFMCKADGIGRIYWNEANTIIESFYPLLSANVILNKGPFCFSLWGKNLTSTQYNTFYFYSMDHSFFSSGRPVQIGLSLSINI